METVRLGELTGVTAITDEANAVGSATLVAFTVALKATLVVGAVNSPLEDTLPAVVLQVTAVLVLAVFTLAVVRVPPVPPVLTVAVSGWVAPEATVATVGVTDTVTFGVVAAMVKRSPRVSKCTPFADNARTVKLLVPAIVGMPEITPVVRLIVSPVGSAPAEME